jgi:RNA polymerase sigma-70 factor (ECF subfamily)
LSDQDEQQRFAAIVLPHLDPAYNLARWLTRDADQAVDAVQEATLRAWQFFAGYRGPDAKPWFLRIVRNTVLTWREKQSGAKVVPFSALEREDGSSVVDQVASPGEDPEGALLRAEDAAMVDRLIARLPPAFREVLVLRELEELSYREIAEVVQAPIGTVMSRLARARQLLLAYGSELVREEQGRAL